MLNSIARAVQRADNCHTGFAWTCEEGVSGQHEVAPVSGRHVHVDHLHGGELLQHRRRRQSGRQRAQTLLECDLQAIGDEGDEDEDVRLDA